MTSSPPPTSYHSLSENMTESAPTMPSGIQTPGQRHSVESVLPVTLYLYLDVLAEGGYTLPPVLFSYDVIVGMCVSSAGEAHHEVLVFSDTEAILEYGESVNPELITSRMRMTTSWVGKTVLTRCRKAECEEVGKVRRRLEGPIPEMGGLHPPHEDNETRFFQMMEDIHTLARQPNGDTLRIPNFSGSIPPGKGEVSYTQWVYEVKDALSRHPVGVVRSWITRSLRGPPAKTVQSLEEHVPVQEILDKLETMHVTVSPYDVMITQTKTEKVNCFATCLESTVADIRKNHASKMNKASSEDHLREQFYQGLRKNYRDSLRYLFDTGATYTQILKAARTAEMEADNFKEVETSKSVKEADPAVTGELQALKAKVQKIWSQSPNQNQPKKGAGETDLRKKKKDRNNNMCYRCEVQVTL